MRRPSHSCLAINPSLELCPKSSLFPSGDRTLKFKTSGRDNAVRLSNLNLCHFPIHSQAVSLLLTYVILAPFHYFHILLSFNLLHLFIAIARTTIVTNQYANTQQLWISEQVGILNLNNLLALWITEASPEDWMTSFILMMSLDVFPDSCLTLRSYLRFSFENMHLRNLCSRLLWWPLVYRCAKLVMPTIDSSSTPYSSTSKVIGQTYTLRPDLLVSRSLVWPDALLATSP